MQTRREFLRNAALIALASGLPARVDGSVRVNDVHSRLNETRVRELLRPRTEEQLTEIVRRAAQRRIPISVSGCRHSMGGQQFATESICIDARGLSRILSLDQERGLIEAEAGIQWPELITGYLQRQPGQAPRWGIAQKQTGADTFTLGGSLSSNVHGRGLTMPPLIGNIESFSLINAEGRKLRCRREEITELFRTAIGGYGLFGLISTVTLRLVPRRKLRRRVEIISARNLMKRFEERIDAGYLYGDFQFSIDEKSPDFLQVGVFSCYEPIDEKATVSAERKLNEKDWLDLLTLAYTDRAKAFQRYADYYCATDGQTYWSDTNQLSTYLPDYAQRLHDRIGGPESSLIITELYVPRSRLADFLAAAASLLRDGGSPVIYGTVRLIEKDNESFLPWARDAFACTVLNLQVFHNQTGLESAANRFRGLIDLAIDLKGSYYLTYHRFATRAQVETCYPNFREFLKRKKEYDPQSLFESDWHRHYETLFANTPDVAWRGHCCG